jgi:hypothetical protein
VHCRPDNLGRAAFLLTHLLTPLFRLEIPEANLTVSVLRSFLSALRCKVQSTSWELPGGFQSFQTPKPFPTILEDPKTTKSSSSGSVVRQTADGRITFIYCTFASDVVPLLFYFSTILQNTINITPPFYHT